MLQRPIYYETITIGIIVFDNIVRYYCRIINFEIIKDIHIKVNFDVSCAESPVCAFIL